jgi:hypothetical protein
MTDFAERGRREGLPSGVQMRESADSALRSADTMPHDMRQEALLRAIALALLEIRDLLKPELPRAEGELPK